MDRPLLISGSIPDTSSGAVPETVSTIVETDLSAKAQAGRLGPSSRHRSRIGGLDLIRGIAILLVLCRHLHLPPPDSVSTWFHRLVFALQTAGWCGVDLFFVLSGFLVGGILFRQYRESSRIDIRTFLIRRGFKIYPAFWLMLEATVLYNLFAGGTTAWLPLLNELCFLQNYFKGIYGHTWSLAVEEHCYLGLALLLAFLTRLQPQSANPFRILPWLALVGLAATAWMRSQRIPFLDHQGPPSILFPTHLRFDGFLTGVSLSYALHYCPTMFAGWGRLGRLLWIVLGGLLILPVFLFDIRQHPVVLQVFLTTNIFAASAWILAAFSELARTGDSFSCCSKHLRHPDELYSIHMNRQSAALEAPVPPQPDSSQTVGFPRLHAPVSWIGRHSYSIYLWHNLLEYSILRPLLGMRGSSAIANVEMWVPLSLATSIGGGIILSYLIEMPALRIRDRWYRAPQH